MEPVKGAVKLKSASSPTLMDDILNREVGDHDRCFVCIKCRSCNNSTWLQCCKMEEEIGVTSCVLYELIDPILLTWSNII